MLASRQPSLISVRRDAWVEIDLAALESNVRVVRSWLSTSCRLMAVVKSDAYGHGAAQVGRVFTASGADWLGVASVDEGCQLRSGGATAPILILSPSPFWALSSAIDANLCVSVTSSGQVQDLATAAERRGKIAQVQLKVDTGMHRLGVQPQTVTEILNKIAENKSLQLLGLYSHLACAEDAEATGQQNSCFQQVLNALPSEQKPPLVHLASGEAARRFPDTHFSLVRVGLYLYGLEPKAVSTLVTPAMSVRARLVQVTDIAAGESVGYGWTWTASRPTKLASIPVGYADGVDRRLSNRLTGMLWGKEVKQVGLISMDQMLFDITDVPEATEGDVLTLIGQESHERSAATGHAGTAQGKTLHLATWATMLDTITYELACRLRVRLPRIYTRHKAPSSK